MRDYSTIEIVSGIAKRKERVIQHVYQTCYPDIRKLILTNTGNEHDVEDIFQEAMIVLFQKITEQGLVLTVKFKTYLYSVCRFLWLQELEKRSRKTSGLTSVDEISAEREFDNKKQVSEQKA